MVMVLDGVVAFAIFTWHFCGFLSAATRFCFKTLFQLFMNGGNFVYMVKIGKNP